MATTYAPEAVPVAGTQPRIRPGAGVLLGILLVAAAALVIYFQKPPAVTAASVSPQDFSSQRAMTHLQTIAKVPHPMGSSENHAVREYLVRELSALGAEPQVQTATVIAPAEALPYVAGTVQNVVARLKGTTNGKALLLMSHYDSAPTAPGASDAGTAVAALLEAARALKAGSPLRNDVIFLLTDGEEPGRFGVRAFINEHPWAKDVGLVFNFEARGNNGPSIMFETSRENGWLVREFSQSAPHPFANSLAGTIYDSLPNDTDFSITKQAGLPGLNFAYINGLTDYHTQTDNLENIDQRSFQHQGATVLAVARHFGNADFNQPRERDAVYFDLPGGFLVHYSSIWILPLAIVAVIAFALVVRLGRKRGLVTFKGIGFGLAALVVSCIAANLVTMLVWTVVRSVHPGFRLIPWGDTYNSGFYKIAFVLLTIGVVTAIYAWCCKRTNIANLSVGAMLGWLLLAVVSAIVLPGGSYLLTWPLLFALAGTALLFYWRQPLRKSLVLAAYALPAIVLVGPLIYWSFVALTISAASTIMIPVALVLGLLTPHLDAMTPAKRWSVPLAAVVLSVIFIVVGLTTAGFNNRHPRMNQIFYGLNANTGKAVWGSIDARPDEWTSQFLSANPKRERMPDLFPLTGLTFLQSDAVAAPLEAPKAQLLEDRREGDVRVLRLQLSSPRKAPVMSAYLESSAGVVSASLNGKPIEGPGENERQPAPWALQYYGLPAEGAQLTLRVRSTQPVTVRIDDRTYQLPVGPNISYRARPDDLMPVPSQYSDTTLVSKTYTF